MLIPSPESALLLWGVRTALQSPPAEPLQSLLQKQPDWNGVVEMAKAHRVTPLLYRSLSAAGPDLAPPAILERLRIHTLRVAAQNLHRLRELLGLLSLFQAHGLTAAPFKGPMIAATVYGNMALREFRDLDLLVPQHEVWKARDLLLGQGYRPWLPPMNPGQETVFLQYEHAYTMIHEARGIVIDLHWAITRRYMALPLNSANLWPRLQPKTLGNREVLSFAPEELLLILCVHGAKHLWAGLAWICDVAALLARCPNLAWEQLIRQAEEAGSLRFLGLGLYLAHDLLGSPLPAEILQSIRQDAAIARLARQVQAKLFRTPPALLSDWDLGWEKFLFLMRSRERLRDQTRFLLQRAVMPTARDVRCKQLPESLAPFYVLLRPIRFLGERLGIKAAL